MSQGSRLAVSRYPRDTRFQFWILDIIDLVSRWDTKKIGMLAKIIFFRCLLLKNVMDLSTRLISAFLFSAMIAHSEVYKTLRK